METALASAIYSGAAVAVVVAIKELIMWGLKRHAEVKDRRTAAEITVALSKIEGFESQLTSVTVLLESLNDKQDLQNTGLCEMLRDRITYLCGVAIRNGGIRCEDLATLQRMHKVYHDLGGNGFLDNLMARVAALPLIP